MAGKTDPIRPTDDDARVLARTIVAGARFGALGVLEPETGMPMVSRVAVATADDGGPVSLISDLAHHSRALKADPRCSLLLGEPGPKGDPLTHPRLTIQAGARFLRHGEAGHADLRARYLRIHPKSKLYIDFADFAFVTFDIRGGYLNAGFGKAFVLTPKDLAAPSDC